MSFNDIRQLAKGVATINIENISQEVKLLTVREKEKYDKLTQEGLGNIRANFTRDSQEANLNAQKLTASEYKADRYLIKVSFSNEGEITEDDIDSLYDIYNPLVKELKRVNHIVDASDKEVAEALARETEAKIKK